MLPRSLSIAVVRIPLTATFRHAAAERSTTESVVVRVRSASGAVGYGEGCPRPYVTGETMNGALDFLRQYGPSLAADVASVEGLRDWIANNALLIDRNPAAFCALETAMIDMLAREARCSAEILLGLPELLGAFHYSAVIGDADQPAFSEQLARYWAAGFRDFKVKLSGQHRRDHAKFAALRERDDGSMRLRADANNLWRDPMECIAYLESLNCPLFALEEPLCAADLDGLKLVAEALGTKIVLDESFLRKSDFTSLRSAPSFWILNCRVSKQGGVIRTLDAVADANSLGIALIVGAHVGETSLLSRTALTVAQSAGAQLLAQEGAFGTLLLAEDLFRPCIAFGPAGRLRIPDDLPLAPHGWGLDLGEGVEI